MATPHSPSIRRRRLSAELRRLREIAGLTLIEAAQGANLGKSNLSKIESAESKSVPAPTLDRLLDLYKVQDHAFRDSMHELARLARERGWWSRYKDVLPQMLPDLEAEASAIRTFHAQVVPGMLQTPSYADAIFRANKVRESDEISQRVAARISRQKVLERDTPPTYQVILEEGVLHRVVGSADVMRDQLTQLVRVCRRATIDLYIVPFSAGAHPATEGTFTVLDFPDPRDSSIAYVENPASALYLEEPHQVRIFNDMFGATQACALTAIQSLDLIQNVLEGLDS